MLDSLEISELRTCKDPECLDESGDPNVAEPEQDGDHKFWVCVECGYEFGWELVESNPTSIDAEGSCAAGVPADLRRAVSGVTEAAAASMSQGSGKISLGLTIGKRPGL